METEIKQFFRKTFETFRKYSAINRCALMILITIFTSSFISGVNAQGTTLARDVAIFDISARVPETGGNVFSIKHILDVAGIPYIVTKDATVASKHAMIIVSSQLLSTTLSISERTLITNYVQNSGVLIVSNFKDKGLYPVTGISNNYYSTTRYLLKWNMKTKDPTLQWFNDPLEQTISLDRQKYPSSIFTRSYALNGATALANFEDGTVAVTKNKYGNGYAYVLGFAFKEVILRNQLNLDHEAQRTYSNGFEPTSDAIILFIRSVFAAHVPYACWKHTSFNNSKSVFIQTHDMDSRTGMELIRDFGAYEQSKGIPATYLVTTHYFSDEFSGNFYDVAVPDLTAVKNMGHKMASHSVGHFPDFNNITIIPEGKAGNTRSSYHPFNDGTITKGATVFGELEVSKKILEQDLDVKIRSFRSGFLLVNPKQMNVLHALGYKYDSSNSANDVLTNFPFISHTDRSMSNDVLTDIYQIPMTISDVFKSDPISQYNYNNKVAIWLDVIRRNKQNNAPVVLLIHPNRTWKLTAEQNLYNQLPDSVVMSDLETYGDFWRSRVSTGFGSVLANNSLDIIIPSNNLPLDKHFSMIVNNGKALASINVKDENGKSIPFIKESWDGNNIILYQGVQAISATLSADIKPDGYNISCVGGDDGKITATGSGGLPPYKFRWSNSQTTSTISGLKAGTYSVTITDVMKKQATASVTLSQPPSGICSLASEIAEDESSDKTSIFSIVPNPILNKAKLLFQFPQDGNVKVEIFTLQGQLAATVFNGFIEKNRLYEIETDAILLSKGIYIYRATTTAKIHQGKLIVLTDKQ